MSSYYCVTSYLLIICCIYNNLPDVSLQGCAAKRVTSRTAAHACKNKFDIKHTLGLRSSTSLG